MKKYMNGGKKEIDNIIKNNLVRFVYLVPFKSLFFVPNKQDMYIVIKDDGTELSINDENTRIYNISEWFSLIDTDPIYPWICACLPKKYVLKEYVKIMMETNPLKLRHYIDNKIWEVADCYKDMKGEDRLTTLSLLTFETLLAIQILENHKIINFQQGHMFFPYLLKLDSYNEFESWYNWRIYHIFDELTKGALQKEQEQLREQKIQDIITKAENKKCQTITTK